ncbi:MAG: DNA-directed RNA polymerase subunit beta' [Candidatus Moranbacteria bacterium CG06_land_8_20_14_3_00_43_56]|nr:MAG: DNA-directed RNA polymerase subunit beta' [Candidatus Moranbacteria bacterium CG06_land_8_20_14_3_00_43_56]PIV83661.1 MAG: DNA-directed RNA polymerase subunit beta' [Candidatus Moranbacteria bacterium CG17_big_fil_post_rev_8_21_14_2_50_44_12]PJA85818.1 MAG: DNA-directed RNA polymerase subunit beta' [Candidatus Moranbacteria bacterium CG_4_9_14_3_um_filter_44_28]
MFQSSNAKLNDFKSIRLRLASPEDILNWSHGEVTKPETINYRTQRYERDGLFCEKIFGPAKDWECYCGKYKKIRYKGIICDKCGVEITRSIVRRERMGHIKLAVPVSHIWFLRGVPSKIGLALGMSTQDLEKVVYFASYVVMEVNEEARREALQRLDSELKSKQKKAKSGEGEESISDLKDVYQVSREELKSLKKFQILSEVEYFNLSMKYAHVFRAGIGAEAVRKLLEEMDFDEEIGRIKKHLQDDKSSDKRRLLKRLKLFQGMRQSGIRPEWMFPTAIPVIPPDLRPMVQLDGGRFATSDLNDLYRRIINRNNRLKKLIEIGAPEVIARNEKRMLQEAVDALFDNSARRGQTSVAASTGQRRALRSLADMLKGKKGRFRQNLLGKRVDYSGRSVIVVGSQLRLRQCGLPKKMALELFKPFIINKLIEGEHAHNVRSAGKMVEFETEEAYKMLDEIIEHHYVLLNRAPTLHRLSIQAFQPVLIEGKAIQIHPMVCAAFNADFDGDQMAVHVPLTAEARREASDIMLSSQNLLKPASGEPITIPSQDMVLGCYYMTHILKELKGEGKIFSGGEEAIMAYHFEKADLRAKVKVKVDDEIVETSPGRVLFNQIIPEELGFVNQEMDKGKLREIVGRCLETVGPERTARFVDDLKNLSFAIVTRSGMSWGMNDLIVPAKKEGILREAEKRVEMIDKQFEMGLLTIQERKNRVIEIWNEAKNKITYAVRESLDKEGPVYSMVYSKARGTEAVIVQMTGMKGLVAGPTGETIELPVKSSFKEGFNVLEYFISTHGARKGMADTALRTATAGYLTRRLVDVAQDVVVRKQDCKDKEGTYLYREDSDVVSISFASRLRGRVLVEDVKDSATGRVVAKKGEMVSKDKALEIEKKGIDKVKIRSVVTCKARRGICQTCYGLDLGRNELVQIGQAVGIVAAQAIGEPGTQLTMRTFHIGGVAGTDITQGLPRVDEIFEARLPKGEAAVSEIDGKVVEIKETEKEKIVRIEQEGPKKKKEIREYIVPGVMNLNVKEGELTARGQILSEGHIDLKKLFKIEGRDAIHRYIIKEVQEIYSAQGEGINDKHIEIIIRQMLSRVRILDPGDTDLLPGDIVEEVQFLEANEEAKKQKKSVAVAERLLLGISKVALSTESFLSAASFQETAKVLINAAVTGKEDKLRGLKENVIIGKLIPAGTGFRG